MDQKEQEPQLPEEVADKYNLVGKKCGAYQFNKFGVIDLSKLTLAKADQLVAAGFPYLEVKQDKAAKAIAEKKTAVPAN